MGLLLFDCIFKCTLKLLYNQNCNHLYSVRKMLLATLLQCCQPCSESSFIIILVLMCLIWMDLQLSYNETLLNHDHDHHTLESYNIIHVATVSYMVSRRVNNQTTWRCSIQCPNSIWNVTWHSSQLFEPKNYLDVQIWGLCRKDIQTCYWLYGASRVIVSSNIVFQGPGGICIWWFLCDSCSNDGRNIVIISFWK
jgi:hypothetical protein